MTDIPAPPLAEGWGYGALAGFVAVLWLAVLPSRPLFNPDEGRYAEIPREMLAGGDWLIPHLNGLAYIEKPPLQYWATALSMRVFGLNEFAARLYTALCALLTLGTVGLLGRRLRGPAAGWRAAGVLGGMLLFLLLGQVLTLDMSLTAYMTLGLAGFLSAQHAGRGGAASGGGARVAMGVAWIAIALGVMTKGLVAAAVPAGVLLSYGICARDFSPWRRLHLVTGVPIFLGIVVPWHWLAARRLPDFVEFFFVHEHVARYLTPSADREEAWWFFIVVLLVGSLPWTLSAVRVVALGWRARAPAGEFNAELFLWIWVVFIGVFFSLSDSKLIPYVLPALPALALLIALSPAATLRREVLATAVLTVAAAVALGLVSRYAAWFIGPAVVGAAAGRPAAGAVAAGAGPDRSGYFLALAHPLLEVAAVLLASGVFVLALRRRDSTRACVFLGVGWCLAGLLLVRASAAVAPIYSGAALARVLALADVPSEVPLYSVGLYDQTLPFYLRRTVTLVAYRGELDYGLRHREGGEGAGPVGAREGAESGAGQAGAREGNQGAGVAGPGGVREVGPIPYLADVDGFVAAWSAGPPAFAVMEVERFDELERRGVAFRELGRDAHRVAVTRPW